MIALNIAVSPEDETVSLVYDDAFTVSVSKADHNLFTYSNFTKIGDETERRYIRRMMEQVLNFYLSI